jgi:FtsZ-binding cell division protein ZapB
MIATALHVAEVTERQEKEELSARSAEPAQATTNLQSEREDLKDESPSCRGVWNAPTQKGAKGTR